MQRDLSAPDIWEFSLERSRLRRGEARRPAAGASRFARGDRDLTDPEVWALSRSRSRRRHQAETATFESPARGASIAALLLVTGGSATAIASSLPGDGGKAKGDERATDDRAVPTRVAAVPTEDASPERAGRPAAARPAATGAVRTAAEVTPPKPPGGVRELQAAVGAPVDGSFGSATKRALKAWQRSHGLAADGVAGARTRAALDLGVGPTLRYVPAPKAKTRARITRTRAVAAVATRSGGGVKALQQKLGLPADGVFGPATERALKRWQRSHGLAADGVAGPQTRAELGLGAGSVLKRKSSGSRGGTGGGSGGGDSSVVGRVVAAANAIAGKPYRYGGGHGSFTDSAYDCSGSVSYALHGGGLLSSPLDSSGFMSYGAPGPGKRITIYAHPGHMYMVIDGRRFDTSARSETGSRWTGTGRSPAGYTVRHPVGY